MQIAKKRDGLEARIHKFTMSGVAFLPPDMFHVYAKALATSPPAHDEDTDIGYSEDDEEDGSEAPSSREPTGQSTGGLSMTLPGGPESYSLPLPSAQGLDVCRQHGITILAHTEQALREGQANEALAAVRLGIGEQSFLFRKALRNLKGKVRKTRAWDVIHSTAARLNHNFIIYNQARDAMIALGADRTTLGMYQLLRKSDLKTSTAIQEPNAPGQRSEHLSWIWSTAGAQGADGSLLGECEQRTDFTKHLSSDC